MREMVRVFLVFAILMPVVGHAQTADWGWTRFFSRNNLSEKIHALGDARVEGLRIPVLEISLNDITPNFGDTRGGGTRTHEGLDIMAPLGASVLSPTNAVVVRTGDGASSGLYVRTANPGGEQFVYMHLSSIAEGVVEGRELQSGDILGSVGNTGNASGGPTHLHFEIWSNGQATDPFPRLVQSTHVTSSQNIGTGVHTTPSAGVPSFTRDLEVGVVGEDVRALQKYLNDRGFLVAQVGPGSPTAETTYFGELTRRALARYQSSTGISPSVGYFGPITRASIH